MSHFAKNLKYLREQKGFTQKGLACSINVKRVSISGYETGRKEPNYDTLILIANVLEVSSDELIGKDIKNINDPLSIRNLSAEEREIIKIVNKKPLVIKLILNLSLFSDNALNLLNNFIITLLHELK